MPDKTKNGDYIILNYDETCYFVFKVIGRLSKDESENVIPKNYLIDWKYWKDTYLKSKSIQDDAVFFVCELVTTLK